MHFRQNGSMRLIVTLFLFLVLLSRGSDAQGEPCSCDREELMANVRNAETMLNRLYRPGRSRREDMESLFSMIGELDDKTIITITDNEVIYRNMVFVFTDDVLIDYFWNDGV